MSARKRTKPHQESFADIRAAVEAEVAVPTVRRSLPHPSPSLQDNWTDENGVSWRPRSVKLSRLQKLLQDPGVRVLHFDGWSGEVTDVRAEERPVYFERAANWEPDACEQVHAWEFRNQDHQSLVWFDEL